MLQTDANVQRTPKVHEFYSAILGFGDVDIIGNRDFWREFFLLKPSTNEFKSRLISLSLEELLLISLNTRELFKQALVILEAKDLERSKYALKNLDILFYRIGAFANSFSSADIVAIFSSMSTVDRDCRSLVQALTRIMKDSLQSQDNVTIKNLGLSAKYTLISAISAFYNSSLMSYFNNNALLEFILESMQYDISIHELLALGMLSSWEKDETQSLTRKLMSERIMLNHSRYISFALNAVLRLCYSEYSDVSETDQNNNSFNMIFNGFRRPRSISSRTNAELDEMEAKWAQLPRKEASVIMFIYELSSCNKLFMRSLFDMTTEKEMPMANIITLLSCLLSHSRKSHRAAIYAHYIMLIILLALQNYEFRTLMFKKQKIPIQGLWICNQRMPNMSKLPPEAPLIFYALDCISCGIFCNLKRNLDVKSYQMYFTVLQKFISALTQNLDNIDLNYHWTELWKALVTAIRFIASNIQDLKQLPGFRGMLEKLFTSLCTIIQSPTQAYMNEHCRLQLFYRILECEEQISTIKENMGSCKPVILMEQILTPMHQRISQEGKVKSSKQVIKIIAEMLGTYEFQKDLEMQHQQLNSLAFNETSERHFLKNAMRVVLSDIQEFVVQSS